MTDTPFGTAVRGYGEPMTKAQQNKLNAIEKTHKNVMVYKTLDDGTVVFGTLARFTKNGVYQDPKLGTITPAGYLQWRS